MTEEEKEQVRKWYEQVAKMKALQVAKQQYQQAAGATATLWPGNIQSGTGLLGVQNPNTLSVKLEPAPPRDLRVEYLESALEDEHREAARILNDLLNAQAAKRAGETINVEYFKLMDFIRNSYPEVLKHFDETQEAIRRLTT